MKEQTKEVEKEVLETDKDAEVTEEIDKDEYIAKLEENLKNEKEKSDEYFDSLKRNMAEFDNFKKRMMKEKETLYTTVVSDAVYELLPVLDNFEEAMKNEVKDKKFKDGMEMIKTQFMEALKKLGLEEIDCENKKFDPELHDAVMHIEDESLGEGQIVEVLRKGYTCQGRVIRHAMVKVAN